MACSSGGKEPCLRSPDREEAIYFSPSNMTGTHTTSATFLVHIVDGKVFEARFLLFPQYYQVALDKTFYLYILYVVVTYLELQQKLKLTIYHKEK